ncbi:MAG TPA: hypothetical protein DCZ34_00740 [Clostridiales bacterium]|nr:hypothetical protein [Clostridiales bacterium]
MTETDNKKVVKNKIEKSLLKKALGYNYKEIVDEYVIDEDGQKLTKRKITTKNVPPDISAVKLLLDELNVAVNVDLSTLSDADLKRELKDILKKIDGE